MMTQAELLEAVRAALAKARFVNDIMPLPGEESTLGVQTRDDQLAIVAVYLVRPEDAVPQTPEEDAGDVDRSALHH